MKIHGVARILATIPTQMLASECFFLMESNFFLKRIQHRSKNAFAVGLFFDKLKSHGLLAGVEE